MKSTVLIKKGATFLIILIKYMLLVKAALQSQYLGFVWHYR